MSVSIIAKVRLANGELNYYDEVSGVFLNWSHPEKDIVAGTNCSNLRESVRCGRIILEAGSLGRARTMNEILHHKYPDPPEVINQPNPSPTPAKTVLSVAPKKVMMAAAAPEVTENKIQVNTETVEETKDNPKDEPKNEQLKTMTVNATEIKNLKVGNYRTLKVDADKASFKVDDKKVATVDNSGVVTGVAAGNTVVTISADGYEDTTVTVTVIDKN